MKSKPGLSCLFISVCFLCLPSVLAAAAGKLNVLLIVSDDLRDTVGCYGNAAVKTPNLDRLAARGVRFHRAYAQYPVCNPSRTSFMTGLRCEQTRVVENTVMFRSRLPDIITMPQLLRQQGWHAASYGKIYHLRAAGEVRDGWLDLGKSWDEAETFQATPAGRKGEVRNLTGGKLKWCSVGRDGRHGRRPARRPERAPRHRGHRETDGRRQTVVHRRGLSSAARSVSRAEEILRSLSARLAEALSRSGGHHPGAAAFHGGGGFKTAFDAFTDQDRLDFQRAYYAGVSFMDAQVGRLLDTLDRLKLWDKTLVIFAGDNGYHHNERNWWNKNTLFERSCRVPLIVAAPGAKAGSVCQGLVELVDFYPTVADYCGVKAPHKLAGQSLRPLLEDPARHGKEAAFTLVTRGQGKYGQTVRTDRWRYTRWSDGTAELYDETNDREETRNLAADTAPRRHHSGLAETAGCDRPLSPGHCR